MGTPDRLPAALAAISLATISLATIALATISLATIALATIALAATAPAQDWPQFRGPFGNGVAAEQKVPTKWSATENVLWRTGLRRPANGSPIVANGRVFLTAPEDAAGKKRSLYCFDRATGEQLWVRTVTLRKKMPTHEANPYCGTTPAADGERVVVWHASAGLHCYDFAGEELWKRDFGEFRHRWGYGTSPVLHAGRILLHSGPGREVFVAALDIRNGKTVWRTAEPVSGDGQDNAEGRLMGSWCTPLVATVDGAEQILCTMSTRLVAYDPADGRILWTCGGIPCKKGDLSYSSPSIADGMYMIVAGYDGPEIGIRLDRNEGDVTASRRAWRHAPRPSNCGSGVVAGKHLYIPDMRGMINCVEPKTGKRLWSERPVPGAIWSSIVRAGGTLYVTNQRGTTIVFRPNPERLEVVATNELGETTNSTPAIAGGQIFLRTHESLFCISATPKKARKAVIR